MPALSVALDEAVPTGRFETSSDRRSIAMPTIAGAVTGSCIGVAWIVGLILWFIKRRQRWNRARRAGLKTHRQLPDTVPKPEAYIIPPDPAIIEGAGKPREVAYRDDPATDDFDNTRRAKTVPLARNQKSINAGEPVYYPPAVNPASMPWRAFTVVDSSPPIPTNIPEDELPLSPHDPERSNYPPHY
ncbi:hypothetical protein BKA93DRAFT_820839 [Sparassis latifolia]|uniref:Uncharacterized protein n=1 Tax=Sparassis crispa TaxID=139825 RepID=A0A401GG48_9APHY|nr:hypothetical protein SCP_0308930 [Sparassis crispa]GBE81167.1 hypothetical protein SCP_0308930 [Sparassis crispa]